MGEALALLGVSVASALIPVINIEAYLVGSAAVSSDEKIWQLAALAGLGQMLGKVIWYYLGANALRWGWIRRKVEKPKAQAKLEHWRQRTHQRPVLGGVLLLASAAAGVPPLAIVAVLAGQLRMSLPLFVTLVFVGRTARFLAVLGGAGWLESLLRGWW